VLKNDAQMLCAAPSVSHLERSPTTRRNAPFQGSLISQFQHFIFISYPSNTNNIIRYFTVQVWLLDQFGVLHDGKQPYPAAISTCN